MLIANHGINKNDTVPTDGIGRRNTRIENFGGGIKIALSEFSIPSMLMAEEYLHPIRHPRLAEHQAIQNNLYKTATILQYVLGYRGQYFSRPKPASAEEEMIANKAQRISFVIKE